MTPHLDHYPRVKELHYDDVALLPRFSSVGSRAETDTSVKIGCFDFNLPVIPANMKCTISEDIAQYLSDNNYFYVMHRFGIDTLKFLQAVRGWKNISISVGVKKEDHDLIEEISNRGYRVDYITIDIAHGHSEAMKQTINIISTLLPSTFIIAGNVCTVDGFNDLVEWGAKAVKVGVGPGAACTTKLKTGFTHPMFSCIRKIALQSSHYIKGHALLIADGGVNYNGDIAKAMCAGADLVMCGKLFSECIDSPAPSENGKKVYFGSASTMNKTTQQNIEGRVLEIEDNGMTFEQKLNEIKQDLQSAISYSGGKNISGLQAVNYILV